MSDESVFNVIVVAKVDKCGKRFIFEMQVLDDNGEDITDLFAFYARFAEKDVGREDVIDAVIVKKTI
ncbi:hypothetical protein ACAX43_12530 [Paraburkholderia sp. IW21]|uniref:hypothetical protein n=1 Tax=Paraburkholderia sp. IW21 TaxID=3242488 RepID=UPI0035225995